VSLDRAGLSLGSPARGSAYWRAHGWPQVEATSNGGRTETASSDHLPETLAWLARLFEVEPVATGEPEGRKDGSEPGRLPWLGRLGSWPRVRTVPTPGTTNSQGQR